MKSSFLWPIYILICIAGATLAVLGASGELSMFIAILCGLIVVGGVLVAGWNQHQQLSTIARTLAELPSVANSTGRQTQSSDDDIETLLAKLKQSQQTHLNSMVNIADKTDESALATAEVSAFVDSMRESIISQSKRAQQISSAAHDMADTTAAIASNSAVASDSAGKTRNASSEGLACVNTLDSQFVHISDQVDSVSQTLQSLQSLSKDIQGITEVIHGVADQTNLLALNASIEAARAGDHGRGFSVVADEVRGLARKTSESTAEIEQVLKRNQEQAEQAVKIMQCLEPQMVETRTTLTSLGQSLNEINTQACKSEQEVTAMNASMSDHVRASEEVSQAVREISSSLQASEQQSAQAADDALRLSELAESLAANVSVYDLDTRNDRIRRIAQAAAEQVAQCFEKAIKDHQISADDLFDRNYQVIPNTNPPKYHTRFDDFTDRLLPGIQEPILQENPEISYAGAVDNHGYFPTHNTAFCKPLTGDYDTDLANNRTKRIFSDRTGLRCAKNTQPFLLQTYKRDTGEIFHDISVPIYIKGKHWGGFRMGYRADH